jgi:hypothetical protein
MRSCQGRPEKRRKEHYKYLEKEHAKSLMPESGVGLTNIVTAV